MLLSFVVPGMGHLYVGRAGTAFAIAFVAIIASPLWVIIWSKTRFSSPVFLWGFLLLPLLMRFASAVGSGVIARNEPPKQLMKWQRPLAYGTCFMLFFMLSVSAENFVSGRFATRLSVPTDAQSPTIKQGDGVWLVRTGESHVPRRGAVVVFRRVAPEQNSAVFIHQAAPVIGTVAAMSGDEVEVTADAVVVNGTPYPSSAGGKPVAKLKLREGQVFVVSSNRTEAVPDSRDFGPLPVGDYAGEVALVQSKDKTPVESINSAQDGLLK